MAPVPCFRLGVPGLRFILFLFRRFHCFGIVLPMLFGLVFLALLVAHGMLLLTYSVASGCEGGHAETGFSYQRYALTGNSVPVKRRLGHMFYREGDLPAPFYDNASTRRMVMAKNTNTYEKRRKEMEKKRKADEKRAKRQARRKGADEPEEGSPEPPAPESE